MKRPMLILFVLTIIFISGRQYFFEESIVSSYDGVNVTLDGIAKDTRLTKTGRQSFTLESYYNGAKIRVACLAEEGVRLEFGQNVEVWGELQALQKPSNEGAFNEWLYYGKSKIDYKMFPDKIEAYEVNESFSRRIYEIREDMSARFDAALPSRESGVIKAMMLGDKEELPEDISEAYRISGVLHIIAISGLHITLLAVALRMLLEKICYHIKLADVIVILCLIFYVLLTGGSPSAVRAAAMSCVTITGFLLGRDNDLISALSFAGVCLLIYEPLYLFDAGFQYSFAAVMGMIVLSAPMERAFIYFFADIPFIGRILCGKFVKTYLIATIAATCVTLPITAWHFYYLPVYSLLGNIIILPASAVLTVFGFISAIFGIYTAAPIYVILNFYDWVTHIVAQFPFSEYLIGRPSALSIFLFYAVLGAIAYTFSTKEEIKKVNKKYLYLSFAVFLIFIAAENFYKNIYPQKLEINILDVGQGDSLAFKKGLISFAVDGGGTEELENFMDHNGIGKLNAAFVSHTDADHVNEIIKLAQMNRIEKIFLARDPSGNDLLLNELLAVCNANNIEVTYIKAGDRIELGKNFYIDCLFPYAEDIGNNADVSNADGNNASLVLKIICGDFSALLTGDIEAEAEEFLLDENADISAQFLKVAHHGSDTSSTEEFLAQAAPIVAAISVGENNAYGHPSPLVLERLEDSGARVYNTAEDGQIKIITDGRTFSVRTLKMHDLEFSNTLR